MRKWHRVALAALLIALVSVIAWQTLRVREPTYLGKPYRFWLEKYMWSRAAMADKDVRETQEAESAIRKIGTNGLPILLRMISDRSTRWKLEANGLLTHPSLMSFRFRQVGIDHELAVSGFKVLRKDAIPAVPALTRLVSDRDGYVRDSSARALAAISTESDEALLPLIKCITGTDDHLRWFAAELVGNQHRRPDLAVPALIENLHSGSDLEAIYTLAKFGEAARSAEPVLTTFLNHPHVLFRNAATNALKAIDPKRAAEFGVE